MSFISAKVTSTPRNNAGQFISARVTPAIVAGVKAYTQVMFDESQNLVPVGKTGDLKASGKPVIDEGDKRVTGYVVYDAPYSQYVEFGTGLRGSESAGAGPYTYNLSWPGMEARPYLRPALDAAREAGFALFKGAVSGGFQF